MADKRLYILGLVCMLCVLAIHAQHITVSAPSEVSTGENFRISYTINAQNIDDFRAASIPTGLEIIAGPYTSQQSSVQIVNGHTSSFSSITFTYTLYAEKAGNYTIGGAHARVAGHKLVSRPIHLKVSGASRKNGNAGPNMHDEDGGMQMRDAGTRITGKDLFVKVSANKKRVHEQEPILLTYKVYTTVGLTQLDGKMPDLTGFHTQEVKLPAQKSFHIEKVNGHNYRCVTWSQYVMYPQMTGKLSIPSITFKGIVVQQNRSVDPFEAFFNGGSGYVEVKRDIVAPGLTVQVDPLPTKPADFSGGVGRFTISSQVNHTTVKAGTPVSLRVVIGGNGNLKLLKQPVVTFPKDFDKYDPKVTDKTKLTANGIEGNMIYDFLVVPRNQGTYEIPPVSFVYYDTASEGYKTIKTSPITLTVLKGDGKSSSVDDYSEAKPEDILPLKLGTKITSYSGDILFGSASYWVYLLLPFVVFVVLLVIFRKRAMENANIVKKKGKKANKIATKRLRIAYRLMQEGKQSDFYDEVLRALWGYVGDKLNIPVEKLSRENISEKLTERDIDANTIERFISALDECEFERYAPGDAAGNMNKTYESAMVAIMEIEGSLKSRKARAKAPMALILFMLMMPLSSFAITKANADAEYQKGNYQQAIIDYKELIETTKSPELYYNLGNTYYRCGNITQAIIAYERAQKLSPGDRDIRFNLQFVQSKTIDKITPTEQMFFVTWYQALVNLTSVDGWAKTAICSMIMALVLMLLYLFCPKDIVKRVGFYGAICLFALLVVSNVFAYQQKKILQSRNSAIVTAPSVTVKNSPADSGTDVFVIHEGTHVDITDKTIKNWCAIKIADGREGWIRTSHIEEI